MATLIGQKITGAESGDQFGRVVGTNFDGSIVAVGTLLYDTTSNSDVGLVKVYKNVNNVWTQIGSDFTGDVTNNYKGSKLSFNYTGDIIAIGTAKSPGVVQVYKHNLTNLNDDWYQVGEDLIGIIHQQSANGERAFQVSLNAEGNIVAIGANENNDETFTNNATGWRIGIVRVYEYRIPTEAEWNATGDTAVAFKTRGFDISTGSVNYRKVNIYKPVQNSNVSSNTVSYSSVASNKYWVRRGEFIEADNPTGPSNSAESSTFFGTAVSISADGNRVTVGAYGWDFENYPTGNDKGLVRTFDYTSGSGIFPGTYTRIGQDLSGVSNLDRIGGVNLSSDGTTISFGSWRNDKNGLTDNGYAKIYTYNSTNTTWEQKGDIFYGTSNDERFGRTISLNGDGSVVAIGSSTASDASGNVKIYQYNNTSNTWIKKNEILGENTGDGFGYSIALNESGSVIVVGVTNSSAIGYAKVYNTSVPNIRITASEVNDGFISNDSSLSLTFTSTQTTNDFIDTDINVSNGALSSFSGSGTTYTATFTPTAEGACTIDVSAGVYTDSSGNTNLASDQFNWTYNNTNPLIIITATELNNNDISNNDTISLTFTLSQATINFALGDITVSNGVLSSFSGSETSYTATFQASSAGACTIDVASGTFTNNSNVSNIASRQFKWTYDNVPPTMTISSSTVSDGSTTNDASIALTFTSSKLTSNFVVGDITVLNGSLSNFSGSGTIYSATFTPTGSGTSINIDTTINVANGAYTDIAGNNNTAASEFNWTYDKVPPVVTITSNTVSDGGVTNNEYIRLIFTSTKPTSTFSWARPVNTNATAIASSLSSTSTKTTFIGTYRSSSANSISTVSLAAGWVVDLVGNESANTAVFNWTWDNIPPTMTITSDTVSNGSTTNDASIALTFTSSKETTNFTLTEDDKWIPLGDSIDGTGSYHFFGQYVAMNYDGDIIAVGGVGFWNRSNNSTYPQGSILVYQYQNYSWNQLGSAIPGIQGVHGFGSGVTLNKAGDVVAAAGYNFVKVYKYLNNDWSEIGFFDNLWDNGAYGRINSLNLNSDGTRIIFGNVHGNPGAVTKESQSKVYEYSNNSWSQMGSNFGPTGELFVQDLNGAGTRAIIGSYYSLPNTTVRMGHGYIFDWDGSTWNKYTNANGEYDFAKGAGGNDPETYTVSWGHSGAISEDGNVVAWGQPSWSGPPGNTTGNPGHTGRVLVFRYNDTTETWSKMGNDIVGEKKWGENEGRHVRLNADGTIIIISSTGSDTGWTVDSSVATQTNEGQVRVFKFDGTDWVQLGNDIEGETMRTIGGAIAINGDGSHIVAGRGVGTTGSVDVFNINLPGSTVDITVNDITVSNGSLSNLSGSGTTYTATFTPTSSGPTTINVFGGVFTDIAGNKNIKASEFNWVYVAPVSSNTTFNNLLKIKLSQQISSRLIKKKYKSNNSSNSSFGVNSNSAVGASSTTSGSK